MGGDFQESFALGKMAGAVSEQPTLILPEPVPPPCCHPMEAFPFSFLEACNGAVDDVDA